GRITISPKNYSGPKMTDTTEINVIPMQPLGEDVALDWLRSQPGGSTTLPAAALARRWGWNERRTLRRLNAWHKEGLVRRRGRAITAVGEGVGPTADRTPDRTPRDVIFEGVGNHSQRLDVTAGTGRCVAVRNAAQNAASVAAPESVYLA